MPWILNVAYLLLLMAASPVLLYRMLALRKYREGWKQKFLGRLPIRNVYKNGNNVSTAIAKKRLWLHAVSVGEVLQLQTVIEGIQEQRSDIEFVITTTTSTGLAVAKEKYPDHLVCYFPLDFSWAVRRAFECIRPDAVVLVELELWPNFILEAERIGTPLALINGRISAKSFRGYRRIRLLMNKLLGCFGMFSVQNETYKDRLVELGAPKDRIEVTGSIKFDRVQTDRHNSQTEELRRSFGLQEHERIFVAGSTQALEEAYALDTWLTLQRHHPELRLILVPRHKERFDQVAELVEGRGLQLVRRSRQMAIGVASVPCSSQKTGRFSASEESVGLHRSSIPPVLLLDTLGELSACWGLADIAFVGGSLSTRGGQNMIEPAAYGAAVLFGPNTWNFQDVVEMLVSENAARIVNDRNDLTATVRFLLENSNIAENHGRIARQLVLAQQGATVKTVDVICALLPAFDTESQQPIRFAA
jgi:3-deoxy-D-manno-octulosonic-acid transferase